MRNSKLNFHEIVPGFKCSPDWARDCTQIIILVIKWEVSLRICHHSIPSIGLLSFAIRVILAPIPWVNSVPVLDVDIRTIHSLSIDLSLARELLLVLVLYCAVVGFFASSFDWVLDDCPCQDFAAISDVTAIDSLSNENVTNTNFLKPTICSLQFAWVRFQDWFVLNWLLFCTEKCCNIFPSTSISILLDFSILLSISDCGKGAKSC